jgi:hypothetical protein
MKGGNRTSTMILGCVSRARETVELLAKLALVDEQPTQQLGHGRIGGGAAGSFSSGLDVVVGWRRGGRRVELARRVPGHRWMKRGVVVNRELTGPVGMAHTPFARNQQERRDEHLVVVEQGPKLRLRWPGRLIPRQPWRSAGSVNGSTCAGISMGSICISLSGVWLLAGAPAEIPPSSLS